jgi:nuclear cap-binding protein subunit 1
MCSRCLEQPLNTPFVAAAILYANEVKSDVAAETISRAGDMARQALAVGNWRTFKLLLKMFACLQGTLEGDGVFPLLEQLFNAAVDLQTASQEDVS